MIVCLLVFCVSFSWHVSYCLFQMFRWLKYFPWHGPRCFYICDDVLWQAPSGNQPAPPSCSNADTTGGHSHRLPEREGPWEWGRAASLLRRVRDEAQGYAVKRWASSKTQIQTASPRQALFEHVTPPAQLKMNTRFCRWLASMTKTRHI